MDKCEQQSYADCDKLVHLPAIAVKCCLEAEVIGEWSSKDFPSKWQKFAHISMQKLNWKVIVADKLLSTILNAARTKKRSYVKEENLGES